SRHLANFSTTVMDFGAGTSRGTPAGLSGGNLGAERWETSLGSRFFWLDKRAHLRKIKPAFYSLTTFCAASRPLDTLRPHYPTRDLVLSHQTGRSRPSRVNE